MITVNIQVNNAEQIDAFDIIISPYVNQVHITNPPTDNQTEL